MEKSLSPKKNSNEIEKSLINSLKKQIDDCKEILGNNWPPDIKKRPLIVRKPVKVELETPKAEIEFTHTHYEINRMELKPPPVLFDEQGQPLRKKFDCMISYQWEIQDFVLDIYLDLHTRNLITWFDIWFYGVLWKPTRILQWLQRLSVLVLLSFFSQISIKNPIIVRLNLNMLFFVESRSSLFSMILTSKYIIYFILKNNYRVSTYLWPPSKV